MKEYTLKEMNEQLRSNPRILYSSEGIHGNQFEIYKLDDGTFAVYVWDDGYPNPMAGGGHVYRFPNELVENFSSKNFVSWLGISDKGFHFSPLLSDEEVIDFFKQK